MLQQQCAPSWVEYLVLAAWGVFWFGPGRIAGEGGDLDVWVGGRGEWGCVWLPAPWLAGAAWLLVVSSGGGGGAEVKNITKYSTQD